MYRTVNDIAIAIAYGLLSPYGLEHPVEVIAYTVFGYSRYRTLTDVEMKSLYTLIAVRLCISIQCGAYAISQVHTSLHSHPYPLMHPLPTHAPLTNSCTPIN